MKLLCLNHVLSFASDWAVVMEMKWVYVWFIDCPINYECPLESDLSCHSPACLLKSHGDANIDILINESHTIAPGRWLSTWVLFDIVVIIQKCVL